jgi:hypothetical protein
MLPSTATLSVPPTSRVVSFTADPTPAFSLKGALSYQPGTTVSVPSATLCASSWQ